MLTQPFRQRSRRGDSQSSGLALGVGLAGGPHGFPGVRIGGGRSLRLQPLHRLVVGSSRFRPVPCLPASYFSWSGSFVRHPCSSAHRQALPALPSSPLPQKDISWLPPDCVKLNPSLESGASPITAVFRQKDTANARQTQGNSMNRQKPEDVWGRAGRGAAVHRRGISRKPARRPRGLYLRRARQGRHHASGVPQRRAHHRPALRRAARPQAEGRADLPDRHRLGLLHPQVLPRRAFARGPDRPARRHRALGAAVLRLDGPLAGLQGLADERARRQCAVLREVRRQRHGTGTRARRTTCCS